MDLFFGSFDSLYLTTETLRHREGGRYQNLKKLNSRGGAETAEKTFFLFPFSLLRGLRASLRENADRENSAENFGQSGQWFGFALKRGNLEWQTRSPCIVWPRSQCNQSQEEPVRRKSPANAQFNHRDTEAQRGGPQPNFTSKD
jgi:hypothetical protein